jgi:hypothetical protein
MRSDWLAAGGVIYVAMESTGECWKPVLNIFAESCTVFLVSAAGRETHTADASCLAKRMRGRLWRQVPLLEQVPTGLVRDHQRRWLTIQLAHLICLDEPMDALSTEVASVLTELRGGEPRCGKIPLSSSPAGLRTCAHGPCMSSLNGHSRVI